MCLTPLLEKRSDLRFIPILVLVAFVSSASSLAPFLLAINGIAIRSLTKIAYILNDVDSRPNEYLHTWFTGFTFLFERLTTADIIPDILDLQMADHASLRSVFSLCLDIHSLDPSINPDLTPHRQDSEPVSPQVC
jgi:hypothetical protein